LPIDWTLASLCGSHDVAAIAAFGLLPGMFLFGVTGGALHCLPMCGPFVLAQAADRLATIPAHRLCQARRVSAGLLPLYHAGRLTTYSALGSAAGGLWGWWLPTELAARVSAMLLVIAAGLLAYQAWRTKSFSPPTRIEATGRAPLNRVVTAPRRVTTCMRQIGPVRGYGLGVLLGFLPCGTLYTALAAAMATGHAVVGGLAMGAFGLGTIPSLALLGSAGVAVGRTRLRWLIALRPLALAANAGVLLAVAGVQLAE
jgi:sulfite exporter TauE/SafE